MIYPQLKYPLDTRNMPTADRLALISYDMVWRLLYQEEKDLTFHQAATRRQDSEALMHMLGSYIEHMMAMGGKTRFDSPDMPPNKLF